MFVKLTLQDSGMEFHLNFALVESFYSSRIAGSRPWTTVLANTKRKSYDVSETEEEILEQLAGKSKTQILI